jgi:hypothetical protein
MDDFITITAADEVQAANGDKTKIEGVAYSGGTLSLGWEHPAVVAIDGMDIPDNVPLLTGHENDARTRIGVVNVTAAGNRISIAGEVIESNDLSRDIIAQAKAGADWQLSIGAAVEARETITEGTIEANGRTFYAPIILVSKSKLREVSVVPVGADSETHMRVAASFNLTNGGVIMDFQAWMKTHGINAAELTAAQTATLKACYESGEAPPKEFKAEVETVEVAAKAQEAGIQATAEQAVKAERKRVSEIKALFDGDHPKVEDSAVAEGLTLEAASVKLLEAIRAARPASPNINTGAGSGAPESKVLEAAACKTGMLNDYEKGFDEKTLEASDKRFRSGIGLQEMLLEAAWANGYAGRKFERSDSGMREILSYAMPKTGPGVQAAFSTLSLPNILSNVANKFLVRSFNSVESAWRRIAKVSTATDFKQITRNALSGNFTFLKMGADGEIKHGTTTETQYTNQADTYARMYSITRQDIINDDTNAFSDLPMKIGRGGALALNTQFWTNTFVANLATTFTAGRGNYSSGAGSALAIAGLDAAIILFRDQTDPDSNPLGVEPRVLLVPTALEATALSLYQSTTVTNGTTSKQPDQNIYARRFDPVVTTYLTSAAQWYLLADPADMPHIEVVFLNGQQTPIVETADADFNQLGIQLRGYYDFGVGIQEYRAAVQSNGS